MPDENISAENIVRELYARISAGDFTGAQALFADDVIFVQAASLPFGGQYKGRDGFASMAERIVASWPGFAVQPVAFFTDDADQVVVRTDLKGQGLDMPMLELWQVENGRITRCQPFYFDTAIATSRAISS